MISSPKKGIFNRQKLNYSLIIIPILLILLSCGKRKDKSDYLELTIKTSPSQLSTLDLSQAHVILYSNTNEEIVNSQVTLLESGEYGIHYEPGHKITPGIYSFRANVGDSISDYFDPHTTPSVGTQLNYLDFNDKQSDGLHATGHVTRSYWPRFKGSSWNIHTAYLNGVEAESLAPCFTDDKLTFPDFQYYAEWVHGELCDPSDADLSGLITFPGIVVFTESTFQDQSAMYSSITGLLYIAGMKTNLHSFYIIDASTIAVSGTNDSGDEIDYILTK